MKEFYLLNYEVKGIKTLEKWVSLSFYKKTITKEMNTQNYNVKGIYGMNGTGKSGIVTSIHILKQILTDIFYLSNPIVQRNLNELINKKQNELSIQVEFLVKKEDVLQQYRYEIVLGKSATGSYQITLERLWTKNPVSKRSTMSLVYEVNEGVLDYLQECNDEKLTSEIRYKTMNLLSTNALCTLFLHKIFVQMSNEERKSISRIGRELLYVSIFGHHLHAFLEGSDDHKEYLVKHSDRYFTELQDSSDIKLNLAKAQVEQWNRIESTNNYILQNDYHRFEKRVQRLYEFIHIFKSDLQAIEIEKKVNGEFYVCHLIMVYEDYRIDAEFESTGIKKLMTLFEYLIDMVRGDIVFIDEMDSNLHDVYLCALLEYLMEYGKGQLCFTTHNVGPMDILKTRKKSIEFLSVDHMIYPWKTNGNYSPARLYRSGMIEGSPFNVDSIDFISVFSEEEI